MTKQEPMLMESPLTKRVFVVTSYERVDGDIFVAKEKHDVTEQFDRLAELRAGAREDGATCTLEPSFISPMTLHSIQEFMCDRCHEFCYMQMFEEDDMPSYCPSCGAKVAGKGGEL